MWELRTVSHNSLKQNSHLILCCNSINQLLLRRFLTAIDEALEELDARGVGFLFLLRILGFFRGSLGVTSTEEG